MVYSRRVSWGAHPSFSRSVKCRGVQIDAWTGVTLGSDVLAIIPLVEVAHVRTSRRKGKPWCSTLTVFLIVTGLDELVRPNSC